MLSGALVDGPVGGVDFRTESGAGLTDRDGTFTYRSGETILFSIGDTLLGIGPAKESMTPADLFPVQEAASALHDRRAINCARFLQSFSSSSDLAGGIYLDDTARTLVSGAGHIDFDVPEESFGNQLSVASVVDKLSLVLRPPVVARNHLRRSIAGMKKLSDVHVPVREGSYLLADIYRPLAQRCYPAILRMSVYGRAFGTGSVCCPDDLLAAEQREEDWFEGHRSGLSTMVRYAENGVSANAFDWVPRGYVVVRVDCRGVGQTPGELVPFSRQEAEDYYDTIEWVAKQTWCNGSVGLLGASYAATNQWTVAALRPPSLRAIIPWASDADAYRDLAYPGGILQEGYRRHWWTFVTGLQCRRPQSDFVADLQAHPFDDDFYAAGTAGPQTADLERVEVPFLAAVSQTATLHSRAGFEAFVSARSQHRHLAVVAANYFSFLYRECLDLQFAFFDRFLKGEPLPTTELPPVRLMMRTGRGDYIWRDEPDWPVPGTVYQDWYLDASQSTCRLTHEIPGPPAAISYSAEWAPGDSRAATGVAFISQPLEDDLALAGHFRARLWVSATTADMDIYVSLRVIDPEGAEIRYAVRDRTSQEPVTWGCLKVSHRALDQARSDVRPWHTHRPSDVGLLTSPTDVVEVDVELMPATAIIPAGCRLRVHVQPVEGPGGYRDADGIQVGRAYDRSYHDGATNTVHTGGERQSVIRLPVVPPRLVETPNESGM